MRQLQLNKSERVKRHFKKGLVNINRLNALLFALIRALINKGSSKPIRDIEDERKRKVDNIADELLKLSEQMVNADFSYFLSEGVF